MRDPKRIEGILGLLRQYWQTYPDLRLGQLVCNIASLHNQDHNDPYYLEDDALSDLLQGALQCGHRIDDKDTPDCYTHGCIETCMLDFPVLCPHSKPPEEDQ